MTEIITALSVLVLAMISAWNSKRISEVEDRIDRMERKTAWKLH